MNNKQKWFAIVGYIAFIVWLLMAIDVILDPYSHGYYHSPNYTLLQKLENYFLITVYGSRTAGFHIIQILTFITWLGSFIFYFIFKD